jgi:hypothetical protein
VGVAVIFALIFGLWWLVFYDSTTYVFTEAQVERVIRPDTVETASGHTVYSREGTSPVVIILRSGASDDELSGVIKRIKQEMAIATEKLANEYPRETIRGSKFEYHNLIIFCAFAQNCGALDRQLRAEVERLNFVDPNTPHFVPDSADVETVETTN